jgi:hypothetical protein
VPLILTLALSTSVPATTGLPWNGEPGTRHRDLIDVTGLTAGSRSASGNNRTCVQPLELTQQESP